MAVYCGLALLVALLEGMVMGRIKDWFAARSKWQIGLIGLAVLVIIGAVLGQGEGDEPSASATVPVPAETKLVADLATEEASPEVTESASAGEVSSGGIDFYAAAEACDNRLILGLPGREYKSHLIIGKRGGNVGLEPDQFIAVYDADIDGAPVIVNCVVDGVPGAVNVIRADVSVN